MKAFQLILASILSAAVAYATATYVGAQHGQAPAQATSQGSTYDRIMKTKTLRCAYAIYAPTMMKDPNSGKLSGIFHDLIEEIAHLNKLEVVWAEEVDYGNIIEGLKAGRYDMFCAALWPGPERAQQALFSIPVYYSAVGLYARADDKRFDGNIALLNDPQYKLVVQDGDINDSIAKSDFPKAQRVAIPQMSQSSQQFQEVLNGKGDAMFAEKSFANEFLKANPGTLKNIADKPIRLFPNVYIFNSNEPQLKVMLDTALQELIWRGFVHQLIQKYGADSGFLEAAQPYASQ
jgi:polar amino acid transport system substrate-binding protein